MQEPTRQSSPSHEQIAAAAYHLWEEAGRPPGKDAEFWERAERSLRAAAKSASGNTVLPAANADNPVQPRPPLFEKPATRRTKKKTPGA